MSELSFSSKNSNFSSIDLLAHFFHVCFFILSHPLYLSYFVFFSPYLIRLLSFLSPLFITTALLVLAYHTVSPNSTSDLPKLKVGTCCLVTTYQTVVAKLQYPKVDHNNGDDHEEFRSIEELEVYKIVFDTSSLEVRESPVEEVSSEEAFDAPTDRSYSLEGNGSIGYFLEDASAILEEIREKSVEEMRPEQVPIDESASLEGESRTGNFLEDAIWEENEEKQDEESSSAQVFDAAFDDRSSPESSDSSGYFSEASSAILEQSTVEKKCPSQVLDAPIDEKSSPEGNGSNSYFFEASSAVMEGSRENPVEEKWSSQVSDAPVDKSSSLEGKGSTGNVLEAATVILDPKEVEEEKEVKPLSAYFNKVEDEEVKGSIRRESKARYLGANDGGFRSKSMVINTQFLGSNLGSPGVKTMEDSQIMGPNLGTFGSMRKEKEWRRTLACKLFEERQQNVDGGAEGMDMLWETYDETESGKVLQGIKSKSKKQGKKINGNKVDHNEVDADDEEEEDEKYEELDNGQLCCLQALKFSAGKMNLGHMARPNLVKFTKAIKGFGWLHHVTKHSKKGYH